MANKKNISVGVAIDGSAKGFKSASEDASKASKKLGTQTGKDTKKMGGFFGRLGGKVEGAGAKIGGLVGNIAKSISHAMKVLMANPIILAVTLLIGAIAGLAKIIKSTDSGMTQWQVRLEQIRAVIDVLRQRILDLVNVAKLLFKGEFEEAAIAAATAVMGVGAEMRGAASAAKEYINALDEIQNAQDNFISQAADMRNEIAKLEFRVEDQGLSDKERRLALGSAMQLKQDLAAQNKDFAEKLYKEELKYQANRNGLNVKELESFIHMTDAQQAAASEELKRWRDNNEEKSTEIEKLYAGMMDADSEFFKSGKENIAKLSAFDKAARDKKAKEVADAAIAQQKLDDEAMETAKEKADLEERQADNLRDLENQVAVLRKTGLEKQLLEYQQAMEEELRNKELTEAEKLAIEEKYGLLRTKAHLDEADKKAKIDQAEIDRKLKEDEAAVTAQQAKYDSIAEFAQASLDFVSALMMNAKNAELKAAGDDVKKKEQIEKKYAKRQKAIAIAQAVINGALGIVKVIGQTGILSPLVIPTIIAATLSQIAIISAQKFATGGIVSGPTLGMVGEYAGAKNNPEVIAPLDKLKSLLGRTGGGDVNFRIEGTALVGVLENQIKKQDSFS